MRLSERMEQVRRRELDIADELDEVARATEAAGSPIALGEDLEPYLAYLPCGPQFGGTPAELRYIAAQLRQDAIS